MTLGCQVDARVALLECVFVALTLDEGPGGRDEGHRGSFGRGSSRTPMLRRSPGFLRGRFRHSFCVALQERYRAKLVGNQLWPKPSLAKPPLASTMAMPILARVGQNQVWPDQLWPNQPLVAKLIRISVLMFCMTRIGLLLV